MKKGLLVGAALAAAAFGGLAIARVSLSSSGAVAATEAREATARFAIENMTCPTCPISVRAAMNRVDGVKSVEVDFDTKTATVVYDPARTTAAEIAAASTKVGYPATQIEA
ncbi:heavy-metal-associated domain-containing protein [Amphiplicatus metriothermophilus]|uniref:Mercuric ion binding protein n=1 Tax=Amphiplicatus metriothermophilus TaxID=1519374 RepID=A0A239PQQ8_9PROT|nr:heavy metal-associated domain-containing protein [Amphiplicatus metriothermophilus]MBB5518364.1 mercuric ion binding protein [Amphiplicatus metriothermophilus]SNT72468.1 mercuric ion binding protein [Amphiplicatus metriothermophilus]